MFEVIGYSLAVLLLAITAILEFTAMWGLLSHRKATTLSFLAVALIVAAAMFAVAMPDALLGLGLALLAVLLVGAAFGVFLFLSRLTSGKRIRDVWLEKDAAAQAARILRKERARDRSA